MAANFNCYSSQKIICQVAAAFPKLEGLNSWIYYTLRIEDAVSLALAYPGQYRELYASCLHR
jgi:hypothetical protein